MKLVSTHRGPYPEELAERLVPMFGFAGDAVLDPFIGTSTTTTTADDKAGRHRAGLEVDAHYFELARNRIATEAHLCSAQRPSAPKTERSPVLDLKSSEVRK